MSRFNGYATLSADNVYRYELGGDIGPEEPLLVSGRVLKIILWIMLNPSTADAIEDDQTIKTIVRFSEKWGYNHLIVGNVYAFRTKDPKLLFKAMKAGVDVVGPMNNIHLSRMVERARKTGGEVIAAWGGNAKHPRVRVVQDIAGELRCLRVNGDGSPVHPLYQPGDLMPTIWQGMAA
jgi:hypothetical protein